MRDLPVADVPIAVQSVGISLREMHFPLAEREEYTGPLSRMELTAKLFKDGNLSR